MHPNETGIYLAILAGVVALAAIMSLFLISVNQYQRKKAALHKEKTKAQFSYLDEERKRIASDLHDDIGSSLSYIKIQLQSIEGAGMLNDLKVKKCEDHIDQVMEKIKRTAFNLMPGVLQREGLAEALKDLVDLMTYGSGIRVKFRCTITKFDKEKSLHIYRIVQEIMNNIMKHAKATLVTFTIAATNRKIELQVSDNGIGFNKNRVMKSRNGLGLHTITERAHLLKGKVYLTTEKNKGVSYFIEIPVE
jgi:signal transduction histidine kinase